MSMAQRWADDRVTTLCIDRYHNGEMSGTFYHQSMECGRSFHSAIQFLLEMERTLDTAESPKAYAARRVFTPVSQQTAAPPREMCRTGTLATFALRILFRQNAGWQGSVAWLEGGQEHSFRSVLELLGLLDSALTISKAS